MRVSWLVLVIVCAAPARLAYAETCPKQSDFADWPRIAISAGDEAYAKRPEQQLYRLRELLREEIRTAPSVVRRDALRRLAVFVQEVLRNYDGSDATARFLGLADIKPRTCPAELDEQGIPQPLCAWETLFDPPVQVPTRPSDDWDCGFQTKLASYVRSTTDVLDAWQRDAVANAVTSLEEYDEAWKNLVLRGYSQYPWEVLVNGLWIEEEHWGPSPNFMILLHPAVGMGVANLGQRHQRDASAVALLSLEVLGYLRYFANHRHYAGLSIAGTLGNLQWKQRSVGLVAHLSGFSLGLTRGVSGFNDGEWTVFWLLDVGQALDDGMLAKHVPRAIQDRTLRSADR